MKTTITLDIASDGYISDYEYANRLLAEAIRKANEENRKKIDEMIEFSMKYKTIVQLAKEQYRGLGKTTQLAKKAHELGAVLIVPNESLYKYITELGFDNVEHFFNVGSTYGVKYKVGFFVDEGVNPKIIEALCVNNEMLGGFSRL